VGAVPGRFTHLNGYSAIYYTYRWSLVIADDLFTRFRREGLRNPQTALAYRTRCSTRAGPSPPPSWCAISSAAT
jgi:thimet oligopeptidase